MSKFGKSFTHERGTIQYHLESYANGECRVWLEFERSAYELKRKLPNVDAAKEWVNNNIAENKARIAAGHRQFFKFTERDMKTGDDYSLFTQR